jgi:molecular chaperone DnaK (HSP70)
MLACTFDSALGGRSIDITIVHHFAQGFKKPGSDSTIQCIVGRHHVVQV